MLTVIVVWMLNSSLESIITLAICIAIYVVEKSNKLYEEFETLKIQDV